MLRDQPPKRDHFSGNLGLHFYTFIPPMKNHLSYKTTFWPHFVVPWGGIKTHFSLYHLDIQVRLQSKIYSMVIPWETMIFHWSFWLGMIEHTIHGDLHLQDVCLWCYTKSDRSLQSKLFCSSDWLSLEKDISGDRRCLLTITTMLIASKPLRMTFC